jgi:hypothetical protein
MTKAGLAHVREEIERRLAAGSLVEVPEGAWVVLSPLGAVPKGEVDWRTIHHLSHPRRGRHPSVNQGISDEYCAIKYASLANLFRKIAVARREGRDISLWKIDLADAYRHCVVATEDAYLLGCGLDGRVAVDTRLPFGCRSSPKLFNLFAEGLHWILEKHGFSLDHYLDDFFGEDGRDGRMITEWVCSIARSLGFSIRQKKVEFGPVLVILGIEVDAVRGVATISADRRSKVSSIIDGLLTRKTASAVELMSIAGHLQFLVRVCPPGRAFIRRVYDAAAACLHVAERRRVPHSARLDLRWWRDILGWWDGMLLCREDREVVQCWSDASGTLGLGGHLGSEENPRDIWRARLPARMVGKDIMILEALALLECMRRWKQSIQGTRLICHVDNTVLYWSLRSGSCANRSVQAIIRAIYSILLEADCEIWPQWISSGANGLADALSRFADVSLRLPTSFPTNIPEPVIVVPDMPDDDDCYFSPPSSPTLGPILHR